MRRLYPAKFSLGMKLEFEKIQEFQIVVKHIPQAQVLVGSHRPGVHEKIELKTRG
jgi:hypothetical protein